MAQFQLTTSPHLKSRLTVTGGMMDVLIALLLPTLWGIYVFGGNVILLLAVAIAAAVVTECVLRFIMGMKPTPWDMSAVLTAVLLVLTLPPAVPWYVAAIGAAIAIGLAKEIFGGIGANVFNPALLGRGALMFIFPKTLSVYVQPLWWKSAGGFFAMAPVDAVTGATPLTAIKGGMGLGNATLVQMFYGMRGGTIGEVSAVLLLLGGIYLLLRGRITWHIPISIIATVAVVTLISGHTDRLLPFLLGGGLMLGSFYMATDWVTSPITNKGKLVYGIGIGLFVALIRLYGGRPEGMMWAILHWNVLTLVIDYYIRPVTFGHSRA